MIYAGSLLQEGKIVHDDSVLFGLGFGTEIPIDLLSVLFAGSLARNYNLLLVDEFLLLNGQEQNTVRFGLDRNVEALNALGRLYGLGIKIIVASDFMSTSNYISRFEQISELAKQYSLQDALLETVPERYRPNIDYPLHELSCVSYLKEGLGLTVKLGPQKERQYDNLMLALGFDIGFAYLHDALALGTKTADPVVHYVPTSRGPNNGQRIFLDDSEPTVKAKVMGNDAALRNLAMLASAAGQILGRDYQEAEETQALYGKQLRRKTTQLVLDNVIRPYAEVRLHG